MKIRFAHILFIYAAFATFADAQENASSQFSLDSIVYNADYELRNEANRIYRNPAMRHDVYGQKQTNISLGYQQRQDDEAVQMQEGDGEKLGFVEIQSVTNRNNSAYWGKAKFVAGRRENILYNETSDFDLLAPYVMADSVGGDLKTQTYIFGGGLVHRVGESDFLFGIDADYRAVLEYRQRDPRPRNNVSTLHLALGIAYEIAEKSTIALHADGRRYKQTNNVKFFSEMGQPIVYHLTGLGTDYSRFRGNASDTYYNGYNGGGGLALRHSRLSISADYHLWTFEKIVSSLNELPMTQTKEHIASAQVGYKPQTKDSYSFHTQTIILTANINKKNGEENIFGDAANNNYPQIGSLEQYEQQKRSVDLTYVAARTFSHSQLTLRADIGAAHEEESYKVPSSCLDYSTLEFALQADELISIGKNYLFLSLGAEQNNAFSDEITLSARSIITEPTLVYFDAVSNNSTHYKFDARLHLPTSIKNNMAFFVAVNSAFNHYKNCDSYQLKLSLGVSF